MRLLASLSAHLHRFVQPDRAPGAQARAALSHDDGIVKIGGLDDRVAGRRVGPRGPFARRAVGGDGRGNPNGEPTALTLLGLCPPPAAIVRDLR
jgi:hypothetical protein